MANPVPKLKGSVFDIHENYLPYLDACLNYVKDNQNFKSGFTEAMVAHAVNMPISHVGLIYKDFLKIFIEEDFMQLFHDGKYHLTQRGKDFDSFAKAKERYIKEYNINKRIGWLTINKDIVSIFYYIVMAAITILTTSVSISKCSTQSTLEKTIILKQKTIDSLKLISKFQTSQNNKPNTKDTLLKENPNKQNDKKK